MKYILQSLRSETIQAGQGLYKDEYGYLNIGEGVITDEFIGQRTIDDTLKYC